MKKFLRLWLRHPISITFMIIWIILGIWVRSFIPVVFGLIPSAFIFFCGELWYYCR